MARDCIEDTVICIDNSDYMRNEDIQPSRLKTEQNSINIICHHILGSHLDNRVSILTSTAVPQVIQPLSSNEITVLSRLYAVAPKGEQDLCATIKLALLVLKHAQQVGDRTGSPNRKRRVLLFVGSPIKDKAPELDVLAKKFVKRRVSIDVVSFGAENGIKNEILKKFVAGVGQDSHLFVVSNDRDMANVLADSPLLSTASRPVSLVNGNTDPDLAMALRLSAMDYQKTSIGNMKKTAPVSGRAVRQKFTQHKDSNIENAIQRSLEFMKKNNIPINEKYLQTAPKEAKSEPKANGEFMSEQDLLALAMQLSLEDNYKSSKSVAKRSNHSNCTLEYIQKTNSQKKDVLTNDTLKKESLKKDVLKDSTKNESQNKVGLKKESLKNDNQNKVVLKKESLIKDSLKKESLKNDNQNKVVLKKESLIKDSPKKEILKNDNQNKDLLKKEILIKESLKKDVLKGSTKNDSQNKVGLKKETPKNDIQNKDLLKKEILIKESLKKDVLKDSTKNDSQNKVGLKKETPKNDIQNKDLLKKEILIKDSLKKVDPKDSTKKDSKKKNSLKKESLKKDSVKNDSQKNVKQKTERQKSGKKDEKRENEKK